MLDLITRARCHYARPIKGDPLEIRRDVWCDIRHLDTSLVYISFIVLIQLFAAKPNKRDCRSIYRLCMHCLCHVVKIRCFADAHMTIQYDDDGCVVCDKQGATS